MKSSAVIESLLAVSARVLVIAPHPDDETLAAGGLIQRAVNAGARVTVVVITDGEANPWPQRAAERRVVIGADERARWGRRRRNEVVSALGVLGVPPEAIRHLGAPDLGLTESLMRDPVSACAPFRSVLEETAPSVVICPSLHDTHPDHSAACVMCALALDDASCCPTVLAYTVHGAPDQDAVELALHHDLRERKTRALEEHRSQLVVSGARMRGYARRPERFAAQANAVRSVPIEGGVPLPWRVGLSGTFLLRALVVSRIKAWRVQVGKLHSANPLVPVCSRTPDGLLSLHVPESLRDGGPLFLKLVARVPSPWIYDRWGWVRIA